MSKRRWAIRRLLNFLREHKEITITKAAVITDYSLEYFRRHILPILLELTECVDYNVLDQKLVWVCDREEEGGGNHGQGVEN